MLAWRTILIYEVAGEEKGRRGWGGGKKIRGVGGQGTAQKNGRAEEGRKGAEK